MAASAEAGTTKARRITQCARRVFPADVYVMIRAHIIYIDRLSFFDASGGLRIHWKSRSFTNRGNTTASLAYNVQRHSFPQGITFANARDCSCARVNTFIIYTFIKL